MSSFKSFAAVAVAMLIGASSADAQLTKTRKTDSSGGIANAEKLDDRTSGTSIRASQLMGVNIQNMKGESVGEIKDIVLDTRNGRVRYAAVTYGGLLGVGNELFAVPFEAFQVRTDPDDRDDYVLVLDVSKERLDGAKGFNEETWPDFADTNLTAELDKRYGVERKMDNRARLTRNRDVDVDVDVKRDEVKLKIDRDRK